MAERYRANLENEGTNKDRSPNVDVRPNAGIVRSPLDEIKAIQTLLADVYKDAGDGRTLFRELVQNADDAGAQRLTLTVLERGWPDARNSLLRGPALLVANDGPFPAKDREALHKAIGGSKEDDASKIGTFGIGLKSAFHICEAFLYIGTEKSKWRAGVLNPWAGTGESREADPVHPEWAEVKERIERLQAVAAELIRDTSNGLMLWIPLRRPEHLNRGTELGKRRPKPDDLCDWFGSPAPAALLLAQCGHLKSIEVYRTTGPESLHDRSRLVRVARQRDGWIGRHENDSHERPNQAFEGSIKSNERNWSVVGIEVLGGDSLRQLRSHSDWPPSPQWQDGRYSTVPRKALAHAAVTVLRPDAPNAEPLGTRLRWAVFLPLDDDPEPRSSEIVESKGSSPAWEIVLHGYFWPSQDRRSIPGVTDDPGNGAGDTDMRNRWNRAVCDDLLLPLLPSALAKAVDGIEERVARRLLETVVNSEIARNRSDAVKRRHWLLPLVAADGVRWEARDAKGCRVLSIPKWSQVPEVIRRQFLASCHECRDDVVFIDKHAPSLAGEFDDWTVDHLERLLNCIPGDAFGSPQSVQWIEGFVRHVLDLDACGGDIRAVAVARWLVGQIGDGALAHTTRHSASRESRNELRDAWRGLCEALPNAWLVETPVDSQQAVAELAAGDVFGEGLFPVPFGRRRGESPPAPQLDQERLDRALYTLGRRLEAGGESERLRHSQLLLAETLLSTRHNRPLGEHLVGLPLLRAIRLPEDREEAWSIAELRCRIENRRVFASPASEVSDYDGADGIQPERPSDPKRAAMELAKALNKAVWMVSGDAVASVTADVPSPAPEALANAVLRAEALADPACRKPLLMRLVPEASDNTNVRWAARVLLAGSAAGVVGEDAELFHNRTGNRRALRILLRLLDRSWCAVEGMLVEPLSQEVLESLSIGQADHRALHDLLGVCLDKPVDWTGISDGEALQLLQDLHGPTNEEQERWRRMPLHRGVDGMRGALNHRARCSTGKTDELRLPPELEAEVRLLDPESEVAHLYAFVPVMDRDGLLQLMLEDSRPWRFAEWIVQSVRSADGQMTLPQASDLRERLRHTCWLPVGDDDGVAPAAVLIAPKEVLKEVSGLAAAGAFGDKRLPEDVHPETWQTAERVVREILGRLGQDRQVQRIADALNPYQVAQVSGGAYLVMPDPELVDASLIEDALKTTLADSHPGWKMVHAAAHVIGYGDDQSQDSSDLLVKLTQVLSAPVPTEFQIKMLTRLANSRPAKDSPGGRLFRTLLGCFAEREDFLTHVLPELYLPTQDGAWHASRDVARTETGVARQHRLISELRPILRLSSDQPVLHMSNAESSPAGNPLDALERYFEPWHGRVQHGAVGTFLSLLGNGLHNVIGNLAEQWLGEDVSIEPIDGLDRQTISVFVSPKIADGDRVNAVNVLGSRVEMEAEADDDTLFAVDPVPYPPLPPSSALAPLGPFWEITLRDVEPQSRTPSDLTGLLGNTVERWAVQFLKLDREQVNLWWSRWGKTSQADLGPVLASIRANLPLTLQQLGVQEREPLREALREAEQAQRKREQAPAPTEANLKAEREALDRLAKLIEGPEHQTFLWRRVNELMRRYGYGPDSVLLELAQNADDALAQAAEIKGGPLPPATCRLLIRVHEHDGTPTVDITHWGRPINDHGGAAFLEGRARQWDQDLYFMMLMNLSGKLGEEPERAVPSSTTGRFGLGFKSVHLVSSSPSVVSGFLGFSIAGGLLPQERPVENEADGSMIEGRRATRVRLPLHEDVEAGALFRRFTYARALLPVFARQLREVVVEGGPSPGFHIFNGKPIDGAPGWSVGAETELPNHDRHWRVLRFRPGDAGHEGMGTAALAVGLREGVPTAFGPEMPFLWNVAPTSESWGCGYAVNGPFKLDPGRTHVSLDDDATLRTVSSLGDALGKGLIQLHDALVCPTDEVRGLLDHGDGRSFLTSLWKVLACGLDNQQPLQRKFLLQLHGNGCGLSTWMAARPAVPSGLPAPFPQVLSSLTSGTRIEVADSGLDNADFCHALSEIDDEDLVSLVETRCIVSAETQGLLRPLCQVGSGIHMVPLRPSFLLRELAERWDHCLSPERLHALRPISRGGAWNFVAYDSQGATWRGALKAWAADGSLQPLQNLLLRDAPGLFDHTDDGKDELLRATFAPDDRVLDPVYIERSEDWRMFRWLRMQHGVGAAMMADWCADLPKDLYPAAIHYLLHGDLGSSVLQHLVPIEGRPRWLREYDDVCQLVEDQCEEFWRRQSLLGALFPDHFHAPEPRPDPIQLESGTSFQQLLEWWGDAAVRSEVISAYERAAWPDWLRRDSIAKGLRIDSVDHWLALLVLGACRSLGRTQDHQHRSFLELAHKEGWWDVFKTPEDAGAWMGVLRDWQDHALAKLTYPYWMSLFPAIYQLSRYRNVYVRLLKSAGRRPESMYQVTRLLAPRVDEALTGAGTHFDAPPAPLNMGLHWVLRELVRLEVVQGDHLYPDCWVPSEQVLVFLRRFGLEQPDGGLSNSQKAHTIDSFLATALGTETPNLHLAFDIPLRHIAENEDLRRELGLER